jgi:E3 ubiquitin-protein ligase synoviolin
VTLPATNVESGGEQSIPPPLGEPLPSTTSNATSQSGKPRFNVPPLIPLYDYRPAPANQPLPQYINAWQRGYGPPVHNAQAYPPGPSIQTQLPGHQTQARPTMPHFPTSGARPRTPFHQMPPNLTDEQLAVMDHLTREAIDERLRVLEGVSGAVFRCIDELLRMRSVLPPSSTVTGTGRPSAPQAPDREPPTTSDISQMTPLATVQGPSSELGPKRSDLEEEKVPPLVQKVSEDAPAEGGQHQ